MAARRYIYKISLSRVEQYFMRKCSRQVEIISYLQAVIYCYVYHIKTFEIPNHFTLILLCSPNALIQQHDLLCITHTCMMNLYHKILAYNFPYSHCNMLGTIKLVVIFLYVEISCFRMKAHLVFHWFYIININISLTISISQAVDEVRQNNYSYIAV